MAVDESLDLDAYALEQGRKQFTDWHWGEEPQRVMDWNDRDYPSPLIQCGKLIRLHVRGPRSQRSSHPRRERDAMIEFSKQVSRNCHIAYDPNHPNERLYLLIGPSVQKVIKDRFWDQNSFSPRPLGELAAVAGGRHGKANDYPRIMAKPIGVLTAVVYFTHKRGDENADDPRSYYIHQVGEVSGKMPFLCVDNRGRLWLAGGHYRTPSPGITD